MSFFGPELEFGNSPKISLMLFLQAFSLGSGVLHLPKADMSSAEAEALATTPLRHLAEQHLVETPPSSLLPEMLGVKQLEDSVWQGIYLWEAGRP